MTKGPDFNRKDRFDVNQVKSLEIKKEEKFSNVSSSLDNIAAIRNSIKTGIPLNKQQVVEVNAPKLSTTQQGSLAVGPVSEIISSNVIIGKGTVDNSSCVLSIEISGAIENVISLRVFRADNGVISAPKPSGKMLSILAPANSRKEGDTIFRLSQNLETYSVGSQISEIISAAESSTEKKVTIKKEINKERKEPIKFGNREVGKERLVNASWIDQKVASDPTFFINVRSNTKKSPLEENKLDMSLFDVSSDVDKRRDIKLPDKEFSSISVEQRNAAEFKQISSISPTKNIIDITDSTTIYGRRYTYMVVAVSLDGKEGPRSKIVSIDIIPRPEINTPQISFVSSADFVRFIAVSPNADRLEVFRAGGKKFPKETLSLGMSGSFISSVKDIQESGRFRRISDVPVNHDGNVAFFDRDILPGDRLEYRIYSVDGFGRKYPTPFECNVEISDGTTRILFEQPKITIEQFNGQQILVSAVCNDKRITSLVFGRTEVSNKENCFRHPGEPDIQIHGQKTTKRKLSSRILPTESSPWTGTYRNSKEGVKFTDNSVRFDRSYRYSVYGVDSFGNKTGTVISTPVGVYIKPQINTPKNLSVEKRNNKFIISWETPNDVSAELLVGNQEILNATNVKTVFQVEKSSRDKIWELLPYTTSSYTIDEDLKIGETYFYRVLAMQTGGFISPRTDHVEVTFNKDLPQQKFSVSVIQNGAKIDGIKLFWKTDLEIEKWEIERSEINKLAGSNLINSNEEELSELKFDLISSVTRESSRELSADYDSEKNRTSGDRFFSDRTVDPANVYVYRLRSVLGDSKSAWVYQTVFLFDRKIDEKISGIPQNKKIELIESGRALDSKRLKS